MFRVYRLVGRGRSTCFDRRYDTLDRRSDSCFHGRVGEWCMGRSAPGAATGSAAGTGGVNAGVGDRSGAVGRARASWRWSLPDRLALACQELHRRMQRIDRNGGIHASISRGVPQRGYAARTSDARTHRKCLVGGPSQRRSRPVGTFGSCCRSLRQESTPRIAVEDDFGAVASAGWRRAKTELSRQAMTFPRDLPQSVAWASGRWDAR